MNGYHLRYEDFTVGWVTALPIELAAARKVLDEEYEYHDDSSYTLGRIGEHNVVVACFPSGQLGIANGATVAASLKAKFPAMEFCLMVGIGGGVPSSENDIRLGDVVVSQPQGTYGGVVQYDLGKTVSGGQQTRTGFLNAPPASILRTVSRLQSNHTLGKDTMSAYLSQFEGTKFDRRNAGPDVLYQSSYIVDGESTSTDCPQESVVPRTPRTGSAFKIHYGTIASGNQVMKDATTRDRLSAELGGVLCFEMEAAGLMNNLPCLVIRGISDYCDSHKNASWQPFAAAVAAAYAKELLILHPPSSGLEQRRSILAWIAPLEQQQRHAFVTSLRVQGTGGWLVEHPEYTKWRDDFASPNVLWCHGMGGAGKTVLFSNIIDVLKQRSSGREDPVVFHYFDYEHQSRQTFTLFLRALLRQLLDYFPNIPKKLVDAHTSGSPPSVSALQQVISESAQSLPRFYILIDALDECVDPSLRRTIVSYLGHLACISKVRLLLTSRPHVQEVPSTFPCRLDIPVRASEMDLKAYVSQEISRAGNSDMVDADFAEEIANTITQQADGMFFLTVLRTKAVLREPTTGDMEDSLSTLAKDLPDIFRSTISRIRHLPEGRKRLGMTTLMFLAHVKRPITTGELTDILSVQLSETAVRPNHQPVPRVVVECCLGLVAIDPMTDIMRLSHYAVNEYLLNNSSKLFGDAEAGISALCLTYLLLEPFAEGPRETSGQLKRLMRPYPFISYAVKHWGDHVRGCESSSIVWYLTFRFLDNQQAAACAHQVLQFNRGYREIYWAAAECNSVNALHMASEFGLEKVVDRLLSRKKFKVNAPTTIGTTALIKAASNGQARIVKALLRKGADPSLENWYGNALHCAAEDGHSNTIRQLVSSGMSPNVRSKIGRHPLDCTLDRDSADAFETLLDLGAKLKKRKSNVPLLVKATFRECVNIVDVILKRGLEDVNCATDDRTTAAHVAADMDNTAILGNLIKHGARVDVLDNEGLSPLDHALTRGSGEAAKLLKSYGAKRSTD